MYVITYGGKPATIERLYRIDDKYNQDHELDDTYIAARTKAATIAMYLYYFGFSWKERTPGTECQKVLS